MTLTQLKEAITARGYKDIRTLSGNSLGVVVAKTKVDAVIPELLQVFKAHRPVRVSDREMRLGHFSIFAKNANMQRIARAFTGGRGNEFNLKNAIEEYIEDYGKPLDIEFVTAGGGLKFIAKDVLKVLHVGAKNIFQRNKADLHLVTSKMTVFPISIKDDNASFWESADSYWGEKAKVFLVWALEQQATTLVDNGDGGYSVQPPIAMAALPQEVRDVVFGADLYGRGCVVVKKFLPNSFAWDFHRDVLMITCTHVITKEQEIPDKHRVYFQIQNDRTRETKTLYKGLRTKAAMRGTLYGTKLFEITDRTKLGV